MINRVWKFRSYVSAEGEDMVRAWFEGSAPSVPGLSPGVQGGISSQLLVSRNSSPERWKEAGHYDRLEGKLSELEQLKFVFKAGKAKAERRDEHYRILGFSEMRGLEFTMLYGFLKTRGDKDYIEFGEVALERMRDVRRNKKFSRPATWLEL